MIFTLLYNLLSKGLIVLLVAMLSVNYLPEDLFNEFPFEPSYQEPPNYDLAIPQWNSKLSGPDAEYLHLNNVLGPESIAIAKNGLLYTGLADGRIVELDPSQNYKMRQVLRFKNLPQCRDNVALYPVECGRFLQMRFLNDTLYGIESNSGLYTIDIKTGTKAFVGPKPLNKLSLYNGFAFDPKELNLVYITIASKKWDLKRIIWSVYELEASGQIIALDVNTGKRVIVLDDLMMANGVDVDRSRDQLVFTQTSKAQFSAISLESVRQAFKKSKDGDRLPSISVKVLISIMPGTPDNVIIDGDIAYIGLPFVKAKGKELMEHMATMPRLKKAYSRAAYGLYKLVKYIHDNLYRHPTLEVIYEEFKSGHFNYRIGATNTAGVVKYNLATGASEFLGSDAYNYLSEARPDSKGNLLLGSYRSPFLVKVKL